MFQESSKGVEVRLKSILSSFKGVSRVFLKEVQQREVSMVFQGSFKSVSRKF